MRVWLIVPVKSLGESKSRLAAVLPAGARAGLMRRLLRHVLTIAQAADCFAEIMVISRDPQVWALAHLAGVGVLREDGHTLNAALEQARQAALGDHAEAILVLPADLPQLTVADLDALVALAQTGPGVVIAPSSMGGTSALLLRPPDAIPFAFGIDSFARHCLLAQAADLPCRVHQSPTLAFDVDLPADWVALQNHITGYHGSPCTGSASTPHACR